MTVRLQKLLARAGVASRRSAEDYIRAGRVRVNGKVVERMGVTVDPARDEVRVDGRVVRAEEAVWVALNKPAGYVTTRRDPQGRPTVYDLLPRELHRLFHVGRLDTASEGLLLLTNDGDVANRLLHPRYRTDRVYEVEVEGELAGPAVARLRSGIPLEDGVARAVAVRVLPASPHRSRLRLTMREGRNREVRRMFEVLGHRVLRLRRVRYGPIRLVDLRAGEWRVLTREERAVLAASPDRED